MWNFLDVCAGGVLALIGAYFGNRGRVKAEDRRWRATEKSKHSVRTAERLSKLYSPLVQAAATIQSVAYEMQFLSTVDGTVEKREKRHAQMLNAAHLAVTNVGGKLLIDKDARPIRALYESLRKTFDSYLSTLNFEPPGTEKAKKVKDLLLELSKLATEVQDLAENQLDQLNVIPVLED